MTDTKLIKVLENTAMSDTRLVKVLKKFSKKDFNRLKDFIHSPYFRASKTERDLFDFIDKYTPGFEHAKFTKEKAAGYIFPNEKINKSIIGKITRLQSRLLKKVELFIYYHFRDENSLDVELTLLRFYNTEKLIPHFNSTYNNIQRIQENTDIKGDKFYYDNVLIEYEYRKFQSDTSDMGRGDMHIQNANDALDVFYLIRKLREFCLMYNRQLVTRIDFNMTFKDEILEFLAESNHKNIPVVRIWHTALLLLKSEEKVEHYQELKKLLEVHAGCLSKSDKRVLYTYLENTLNKVFEGEAYFETMFTLYKKQLESEVMYIDGYLLPRSFKNIVTVALHLNQLKWVEDFLEYNKNRIVPTYEYKEDVYGYALAELRFKEGKFDEAVSELNQRTFSDIYTKMDVRRLYMKVYFEKEDDLFDNEVGNFRSALTWERQRTDEQSKAKNVKTKNDNILPTYIIQAYNDFANICNSIYYTAPQDNRRIETITGRIKNTPVLPEKTWLLEKLEALQ